MTVILSTNKIILRDCNQRQSEILKTIHGGTWRTTSNVWEFPMHESICRELRRVGVRHQEIENELNKRMKINFKAYRFKTEPFQHQIEGIKFILNRFGVDI